MNGQNWNELAWNRLNSLTKPRGSLGRLEEIAAKIVAIQQTKTPSVARKAVFVFAADHGVAAEGVSAYPSAVTEQMVRNFLNSGAAINVLARAANTEVHVIDVGVDAMLDEPQLISRKVRRGSRNLRKEPAMSDTELQAALQVGAEMAERARKDGPQLVAAGEMGIGNTTAASAMTAALTGLSADEVTGAGTGVTGAQLKRKAEIIGEAVKLHFPNYRNERPAPMDVLRCLGGLEIAAMAGFFLAATKRRLAIVMDGFISGAAAAIACLIEPDARRYLFAGHQSEEIGHRLLLQFIGEKPLLDLAMRLGEGTGAVLAFSLIEAAVRIYNEMATFHSAGVSEATPT